MTTGSNPCGDCGGSGSVGNQICIACFGSGALPLSGMNLYLSGNFIGINVFHSYQILECLDATEHNALTDAQKDGVLHLLACGLVDLNDGKAGKVRLWNWFGAESTTVANLTALIG